MQPPVRFAVVIGMLTASSAIMSAAAGGAPPAVDEIIFAVRQPGRGSHWYENFGYSAFDPQEKLSGAEGRLCRYHLPSRALTVILEDPRGAVRDPQLHYDARKILFSYRRGDSDYYHLYEIDVNGANLRQLTSGPYDDLEPTYLPDGHIMFCSSRCRRWVNCWYSPVAVLHACDADGSNIHPISGNIEHDNTPWPLADGRVIYQRWEYVDRSRVSFHHLWTANPDGTAQMIFYGNMHPGTVMIDAKPIPGSDGKVVAVFSPNHGQQEHAGVITVVSPKTGPDDLGSACPLSTDEDFRDPYPLSEDCFLVARGASIAWMNGRGETEELLRLPADWSQTRAECHEPRPLERRAREPVIPQRADWRQATGTLLLQNVYTGRRMEGLQPGDIRRLLVLETLPKPVNDSGKMPPMSFGGTYTLERVLGTVPVEADGSAHFEVPALRPLFFVALDEANNAVKRMHSFVTVMPGETVSCVGCHEQRTEAVAHVRPAELQAAKRPPSRIAAIPGIPDVFDFPRDIQPILDRHCVACHDNRQRDGGIVLNGDRGPVYSLSYYTLTALGFVSDGRDRLITNLPPRAVGTSASPLMKMLDGGHYGARLDGREQDMIRYWIESAAAYPGTYAALGTGMIGGYPKSKLDTSDQAWPNSRAARSAIERRCGGCHDRARPLPKYLSDDLGLVLSNPDFSDVRVRFSRHLFFNLSQPEESLMLLAPLAKEAGGLDLCRSRETLSHGSAVFANTHDADYQRILAMCREGHQYLQRIKRFDMPGFRPSELYLREMVRFGVLPSGAEPDNLIDSYATDAVYWRLHWWQPEQ